MNRKDKYFNLGLGWLHYIHYYPARGSVSTWGWAATNFKEPSIDFYFGKHVFVFTLRRWS